MRNIFGCSVTVDVLCTDSDGSYYNIEMQKGDNDDHQKRVRYDGSCIADLMQLFTSSHVHEDQRFPRFCASAKYFKEGEGQKRMSSVFKSYVDEYAKEYTAKQSKEFVIKLFKKKMSYENIKDVTNLPDEILKELQESIK